MLSVKLCINVDKNVQDVSNMQIRRSRYGVRNGGNDYLRKSQCLIKMYILNPVGMEIVELLYISQERNQCNYNRDLL